MIAAASDRPHTDSLRQVGLVDRQSPGTATG